MSCERCASVMERAEEVATRNETLQRSLVKLEKENRGLRTSLAEMHKDASVKPVVEFVVERWRGLTGRRQGLPIGPKQEEVVAKAVKAKWCGRDRALKAVRGISRYPYTSKQGRVAEGPPDRRFDELTDHILKDDETVRKACALADRADREDGLSTDTPPAPAVQLGAWPSFDELGPRPSIKEWWADCPACGSRSMLRIRWVDQGAGVAETRCARGCAEVDVGRALSGLRDGGEAQQRMAA